MVRPRTYYEAPAVTPLPYGLLSAAIVTDDLSGHDQLGYQYEPEACGVAHQTRAACETEAAAFLDKTEGVPLIDVDPFTLYSLFVCRPVGVDLQDLARRSLRMGEQRGLEKAVAARLPLAVGAVDLSPAGVLHPVEGLAALEGFAAANYGGVPTVHVPRTVGSLLGSYGSAIRSSNGARLESVQGALIASGGGYEGLRGPLTNIADPTSTQIPAAGQAWLYVTGVVLVRRSPTVEATPLTLPRAAGGVSNDATVLAERPYAASWECITGAVRVATRGLYGVSGGTP